MRHLWGCTDTCIGVGRRGAAGSRRGRAGRAFDVHTTLHLHTTKSLARRAPSSRRRNRGWTWRRRRSPGTAARPASESSDDCWPAQAWWTTTSLGPPNCHTEQWSLPPSRTRSEPSAKSGLPLGRTRFLNSQRARVARHNPPRVIGKPGSLPSLCLLGGHVLRPRLRLVPAAAAAVAAPAAAVTPATSPVVVAPAAIIAAVAPAAAAVAAAAAAVVVAAAAAAVAPAAVVVAAACIDNVTLSRFLSLDGAIDEDAPRSP